MKNSLALDIAENLIVDTSLSISNEEFLQLSKLIYDHFGIFLPEVKKPLLIVRLQKLVKELGYSSFDQYYHYLNSDRTGEGLSSLVNKISTNFTYFYREEKHFEHLSKEILPELKKKLLNTKSLRIWCAGCATGEEPYTLAMLLLDSFGNDYKSWDAGILATDISEKALNIARIGTYSKESIGRLPSNFRTTYFTPKNKSEVEVKDTIKKEVTFRRYNLMNKMPPFKSKFHIIFCRNVMIYFDNQTRNDVINRFVNLLLPGGYLFIGHSETLGKSHPELKYIIPSLYRRENG